MQAGLQMPLAKLFIWTAAYALLFAIAAAFSLPLALLVSPVAVLTLFVLLDFWVFRQRNDSATLFARAALSVAHFSTAFALAVAVSFATVFLLPASTTPVTPAASLSDLSQIGDAVVSAALILITYFLLFTGFSLTAFTASLFAIPHYRAAKWYAAANVPGILFALGVIAALLLVVMGRQQ